MKTTSMILAVTAIFLGSSFARADAPSPRVTTVPVPENGKPVSAKIDEKGTIHLLYETPAGPRYVKSADRGKTFSEPIAVVDAAARKPGLEFNVWDMVLGAGGRVHVALGTNAWKLRLPHNEWGFYYSTLEPGAAAFTPVRNINNVPSEGFSLAADDKGNVTACWLAGKLYANVSRDNGKMFGPKIELRSDIDPCECCTTSCVYASPGKVAVLYRERKNNERDIWLAFWNQESNEVTPSKLSVTPWKTSVCPMTYYVLTRTTDGFTAVWPTGSKYDVCLARMDAQGKLLPPGEIRTPGKAWHRTGVTVLTAADGSTLVAWTKDQQLGWQLYDAAGQPSGVGAKFRQRRRRRRRQRRAVRSLSVAEVSRADREDHSRVCSFPASSQRPLASSIIDKSLAIRYLSL